MKIASEIHHQALLARDPRFDGKFFVAVKTTGIYCRPICPAKPKRENIEYFPDAYAAEKAGYRPCLRCRPETAPHSPVWMGRSATVQRALRLIAGHARMECDEEGFANLLGVSARHLRRLFQDELGKTPKQISDLNRLNFSKKLVIETSLPITEIALSSGFASIRRFNDSFKERFHRAPSSLRKSRQSWDSGSSLQLRLPYRPPLDWESLLEFYRAHEIPGVEKIGAVTYERVFEWGRETGGLRVEPASHRSELLLTVSLPDLRFLHRVVQNVRSMLDLDSDPLLIAQALSSCDLLGPLEKKNPGIRIARGWDAFESSICIILGQLVSVEQARRLIGQLVSRYGREVKNPLHGGKGFLFPTPKKLAALDSLEVSTTSSRKAAIQEFSKAVASRRIRLDPAQDPQELKKNLLQIQGIGPWTADSICMRALGDPDAFPAGDLILRRALAAHPSVNLGKLKPWRAYAAVMLWKEFSSQLSLKKGKK